MSNTNEHKTVIHQHEAKLLTRIPTDLHLAFKIKCVQKRTTMSEEILNLIKESVGWEDSPPSKNDNDV